MRTPFEENFRFRMPVEVHSGYGITEDLITHLDGLNTDRTFVVIDRNVKSHWRVESISAQFAEMGVSDVADGPEGEPDFEYLEDLRDKAKAARATLVIGVGGGSTMDTAKGLSIVLENDGPCSSYQGMEKYIRPGRGCVTIPTLFGSGAEITPSAVFINRKENRKGGINGPAVFAKRALIDPSLMSDAPKQVIASTAMDALVHSIESSAALCATPLTKMFAFDAAKVLFRGLTDLGTPSRQQQALEGIAEGAFKAVLSLMHSEQGLAGGASYPLGVFYDVPHGIGGGRLLPHAITYNESKQTGIWDDLANHLGNFESEDLTAGVYLAKRLLSFMEEFEVPSLRQWLKGADLDLLASETYNFRGVMEQNPVVFSQRDISHFFEVVVPNDTELQRF